MGVMENGKGRNGKMRGAAWVWGSLTAAMMFVGR